MKDVERVWKQLLQYWSHKYDNTKSFCESSLFYCIGKLKRIYWIIAFFIGKFLTYKDWINTISSLTAEVQVHYGIDSYDELKAYVLTFFSFVFRTLH